MTQLLQDKSAIANGTGGAVARTFARENATWQRGLVDQQAHQHPVAHQRPDRALNRLDVTVPAANSALQRARTRMREQLPQRRLDSFAVQPTLRSGICCCASSTPTSGLISPLRYRSRARTSG